MSGRYTAWHLMEHFLIKLIKWLLATAVVIFLLHTRDLPTCGM